MNPKIILPVLILAAVSAGAAWTFRLPSASPKAAAPIPITERKILYYQSPMHPWIKSDQPGKCPICGMDMVPVYESTTTTNTGFGLKLSADGINVADVQAELVQYRPLVRTLQVAGTILVDSKTPTEFEFDAYERDIPWLKPGQTMEVEVPGIPGKSWTAEIKPLDNQTNAERTFDAASDSTKIRAEFADGPVPSGDLGPGKLFAGLYAEGNIRTAIPEVLVVSRSAVLSPGSQPIVYVDQADGRYEPRKIKLGRIGDTVAEVLDGLKEGERVVTSGNVLIDAETQISRDANN